MSLYVSLGVFIFCALTIGMAIHVVIKMVEILALPLKFVVGNKKKQ